MSLRVYIGFFIAGFLALFGIFPIIGGVFSVIPYPVIGGAVVVLAGTIAAGGIRIIINEYTRPPWCPYHCDCPRPWLSVILYPEILKTFPPSSKACFPLRSPQEVLTGYLS